MALMVARNSPYLLSLHVHCFEGITAHLVQVGQRCRNLTLHCPYRFDMDEIAVSAVISMPKLKVVDLSHCRVSGEALIAFGDHCHDIRDLNLHDNYGIRRRLGGVD